ncbi:ABC transporter [Pseudarthrobacter sp. NamE5]|uniref:ABC transporter n=1 Tax=Pseudarthrobacter sp. NamE5 TaxID=2576839 RepID=UPI00110A8409|nr:ABC transporter [Pseudarthrobacter sp. NamE5]TLM80844.1 ABC transporter [Pseudarthrobacter sp. NamE5]
MKLRTPPVALAALVLVALAGCSNAHAPQALPPETTGSASADDGHGAIPGVAEVAEPQLHLVAIDSNGEASMLDLLNGAESRLGQIAAPVTVTTDGRYVFAANSTGVDIIDSGVWTWDHKDHFHYYRAEAKTIGTISGGGTATIATGMLSTAGTTGMFFPSSGTAVLVDNTALSDGTIAETLRLDTVPHVGIIAPFGEGAIVTEPDDSGTAARLRAIDVDGKELATTGCPAAAGTITTRVGLVIGCADGAVIATTDGGKPVLEHVPYPAGAAAPATAFDGRKGRPTVAGTGTGVGVWLLNTRQRTWDWVPTATPVLAAAAVDDADGHVVVVGTDGTVQVYDENTKERIAATEPLMPATLTDPALAGKVELTVDGQRAYVSAPAEGLVYEIDYADGARVARTLKLPTQPVHLAETGR